MITKLKSMLKKTWLSQCVTLMVLFSLTTRATAAVPAAANADPATIVQTMLLADTTALQPNTTVTLGVLYKVQPGWHIYWRYPGASGLGTTVQWGLPNGVTAAETLYPVPVSFESPGPVISYGYDGEVLLLAEGRTGDLLPDSGEVEFTAKTRWLMCSDRCIPGKKDLTLKLPIGKGSPANQEVFAKYKKLLPKRTATLPPNVTATAKGDAKKMNIELSITPPPNKKIVGEDKLPDFRKPYFFPFDEKGIVFEAPVSGAPTGAAGGTKVYDGPATVAYTAEAGGADAGPLKRVHGVLVMQTTGADGKAGAPEILEVNATAK